MLNTWIAVASLVITVSLDLLLIPRMGIRGAAIASSLSYGLTAVLSLLVFVRESGLRVRDALCVRKEDGNMAMQLISDVRARHRS